MLRPAILPGLLKSVARNVGYGLTDLGLFELGHVFAAPPAGQLLPDERDHVAVVLTGTVRRAPVEPDRPVDVYDAIDALHAIVDELQLAGVETQCRRSSRATGRAGAPPSWSTAPSSARWASWTRRCSPRSASASPRSRSRSRLAPLIAGARRDLDFVAAVHVSRPPRWTSRSCSTRRCPAAAVLATVRAAGGELVEDARVFDEFRADALGAGKRSLAIAIRFRAPDRTLKDKELGAVRQALHRRGRARSTARCCRG